jgi:hypothetical protein
MELIYQYEYETNTATDLTITSIPQTYRHLKLHCQFRRYPNADAYFETFVMPNADSSNCTVMSIGVGGNLYSTSSGGSLGPSTSGSYISYKGSVIDMLFLDYTNTVGYKTCSGMGGYKHFNGWVNESYFYMSMGTWKSTAALTSLRIYPPTGAHKWNGGSSLYLWGWNDSAGA